MKPEDQSIFKQKFTRRIFLKNSATTAATGVAMSGGVNLLPLKVDADAKKGAVGENEQITYGVCRGDCLETGKLLFEPSGLDNSNVVMSLAHTDSLVVLPGGERGFKKSDQV